MNWLKKLFKDESKQPGQPSYEDWLAERNAKQAQEKAQKQAEWDALPAHRKAARIEYKLLQGLVPKVDPNANVCKSLGFINNAANQQMSAQISSYYAANSRLQYGGTLADVFGIR